MSFATTRNPIYLPCVIVTARTGLDFTQDILLPLHKTARRLAAKFDAWLMLNQPMPLSQHHYLGTDALHQHLSRKAIQRATTRSMRPAAERKRVRKLRRWQREEAAFMRYLQSLPAAEPLAGTGVDLLKADVASPSLIPGRRRKVHGDLTDDGKTMVIQLTPAAFGAMDVLAVAALKAAGIPVHTQARRIPLPKPPEARVAAGGFTQPWGGQTPNAVPFPI